MNCLPLMIRLVMSEMMRNSSVAKILNNSQLFENPNDAYIMLMPMFETCKQS